MSHPLSSAPNFLRNETGATAVEYGLIAALIAVVAKVCAVGDALNKAFVKLSNCIKTPSTCAA